MPAWAGLCSIAVAFLVSNCMPSHFSAALAECNLITSAACTAVLCVLLACCMGIQFVALLKTFASCYAAIIALLTAFDELLK